MNLLIIESPGKRRGPASILGPAWRIEPTGGHVRDLPSRCLQVGEAPDYAPRYEVHPDKREVVERLCRWARGSTVYMATGPDREGEAIVRDVAAVMGVPDVKRIRFADAGGRPDFKAPIKRRQLALCPACQTKTPSLIPAGTSRRGNPYDAFWACRAQPCAWIFVDKDGVPVVPTGLATGSLSKTRRQA